MKRILRLLEQWGLNQVPPTVRKILIGVIGATILLLGVALIVLPGPAFIVIPIGLGVLASEFIWAQRVIKRGRIFVKKVRRGVKAK
jgi:tellurite resistance protein TerC